MKIATDLVVRREKDFLFIRRKSKPFKGRLALPGGFVHDNETLEHAAVRELFEETLIHVHEAQLRLIGVFSRVDRDPRQRVISVAYLTDVPSGTKAHAGDDAADVIWLSKKDAIELELAFDHVEILNAVD